MQKFVQEVNEDCDIYSQLMTISQKSIENAHYETAYHALCAALHYAQDIGDEHCLKAVSEAAKAQSDWIDAHAPEHRLSSQSTILRQGVSLYDTLCRQAATQALLVRSKK
ncbi:hypothetical protein N0Y54_30375 [Nostoc punctiforme UO1]|uniref:hypothetical protein n=1 Tax=Nostoc punctiforme TaxID=272131 RepID=UPI0030A09544